MKKLLFGILALVAMRVHADEITVHNTTDRQVTIITARWKVGSLTKKLELKFNDASRADIAPQTTYTLERPSRITYPTFYKWLFAAEASLADVLFESLKQLNGLSATQVAAIEMIQLRGIDVADGTDFFIVADGNIIRIQKEAPVVEAPASMEPVPAVPAIPAPAMEAPVMQEVAVPVTENEEGFIAKAVSKSKKLFRRAQQKVQQAITPVKEENFNSAILASAHENRVLIINGLERGEGSPIYVRMYKHINEPAFASRPINNELPIKIEPNGYSFLNDGPGAASWFRSPALALLVSTKDDDLSAGTDIDYNKRSDHIYEGLIYHNEILNIRLFFDNKSFSADRFTIGNPVTVEVNATDAPMQAYMAIYVKDKGQEGDYILATPVVKIKTDMGVDDEGVVKTKENTPINIPVEQGFFARLGLFAREKVIAVGQRKQFEARFNPTEFPFGARSRLPLQGSEYVVYTEDEGRVIPLITTPAAYRPQEEPETWWERAIGWAAEKVGPRFQKVATKQAIKALQKK